MIIAAGCKRTNILAAAVVLSLATTTTAFAACSDPAAQFAPVSDKTWQLMLRRLPFHSWHQFTKYEPDFSAVCLMKPFTLVGVSIKRMAPLTKVRFHVEGQRVQHRSESPVSALLSMASNGAERTLVDGATNGSKTNGSKEPRFTNAARHTNGCYRHRTLVLNR